MNGVLLVVVLVSTTLIGAGTYYSLRWFRSASRPPVDAKPVRAKVNPHDAAMTAQLKHFFEGKQCAACSRPIPPVHAGQVHPGLLNPSTNEAIAWNDIPAAGLATMLESHLPICSNCLTIETLRREHPELVVDRHRTIESPSL